MALREDAFIGCAIVLCTMSAACAPAMGDKQDGQPCTRSGQCALGLICSDGACVVPRLDAAVADGGVDEDAGDRITHK